jgi:hypothetical protein
VRRKEARKLVAQIEAAGGSVEESGVGKLKVTGPAGVAHVGDNLQGAARIRAVKAIERHTGLELR